MSNNLRKYQNKIDTQTTEITNMHSTLNKAQEENKKLQQVFDSSNIAQNVSKAISSL